MLDVLRFWCERGADGFRIDALRQLFKDEQRRDNPPNPGWSEGDDPYARLIPEFTTDRPEVQDAIRAMRARSATSGCCSASSTCRSSGSSPTTPPAWTCRRTSTC